MTEGQRDLSPESLEHARQQAESAPPMSGERLAKVVSVLRTDKRPVPPVNQPPPAA